MCLGIEAVYDWRRGGRVLYGVVEWHFMELKIVRQEIISHFQMQDFKKLVFVADKPFQAETHKVWWTLSPLSGLPPRIVKISEDGGDVS